MTYVDEDIVADLLVIGTGAAGAACALRAAAQGLDVIVLTDSADPLESNSDYAQGGIVARPPGDTAEELAVDIIAAGDGLCNPDAVQLLAEHIPDIVDAFLINELQVTFSHDDNGDLDFTQEAAHSRRRIAHADDTTGHAIITRLIDALQKEPRITLLPRHTAVDLITVPHHSVNPETVYRPIECFGAYALDQEVGRVQRYFAASTVLATGGLGQLYLH
ncbi:MAG: FAD-binding protein, partial [Armatimonadetes bacterium]|nr:FAD-binding protein [Armatimonadota bacterium]